MHCLFSLPELHMWVVSLVDHLPLCSLLSIWVSPQPNLSENAPEFAVQLVPLLTIALMHEGLRIRLRSLVASRSHKACRSNVDIAHAGHLHLMMEIILVLLVEQIHCWAASVVLRDLLYVLFCALLMYVYTYQVGLCLQFGLN